MKIKDYFLLAYKHRMFYKRRWLVAAFSTSEPKEQVPEDLAVGDFVLVGTTYYAKTDTDIEAIEGVSVGMPLFTPTDPVTLMPEDSILIKEKTETFYSTFITNVIAFEYAFKDVIPYQNKRLSGKEMDKLTAKALKDGTITVSQFKDYSRGLSLLTALLPVCAPAGTKKMIVPPKGLDALRNKLIKENKDKLDDPTVIADIENQLIAYYKEYLKGDLSEGFYLKDKGINVSLKRTQMLFGGEPQLEDQSKYDLAIPSLREGWQIKDLPMMVNSLRMGSYLRGASTALGGEAAKFSARVFQNTALQTNDCGTKVGIPITITSFNQGDFIGRYYFDKGTEKQITEELSSQIGKTLIIRSPMTCHADGDIFCAKCMGDTVSQSGIGLGSQASKVGSRFLDDSLAKMHGSKLSYAQYDISQCMG